RSVVEENTQGFAGYVTDERFNVRLAQRFTPEGGVEILRKGTGGEWEPFMSVDMEDTMTTGALGFSKDGNTLYMSDSRGFDTGRLIAYDLRTNEKRTIAFHEKADISDALINPITREVEAASFNYLKDEWQFLDPAIKAEFAAIRNRVGEGEIILTSRSRDDQTWTVAVADDDGPTRY